MKFIIVEERLIKVFVSVEVEAPNRGVLESGYYKVIKDLGHADEEILESTLIAVEEEV